MQGLPHCTIEIKVQSHLRGQKWTNVLKHKTTYFDTAFASVAAFSYLSGPFWPGTTTLNAFWATINNKGQNGLPQNGSILKSPITWKRWVWQRWLLLTTNRNPYTIFHFWPWPVTLETPSGRNWTYEHQTYRSLYLSNDTSDRKVTNMKVVQKDEGYPSVSSKIKCGDI